MAYLGTPIDTTNQFQSLQGKRFSGDASTTAFTLDVAPSSTLDIEVYVENVRQDPNSAYSISGTTLTFSAAPPSGTNNIYVIHQAKAVGTINPGDGTVSLDKLSATGTKSSSTFLRGDNTFAAVATGVSLVDMQVITTTSTYTPTSGTQFVKVFCVGAGGGGGGCQATGGGSSNQAIGGGGAGGGTAIRTYNSTELGATAAVTIGSGGTGGTGFADGADGGSTTFNPAGTGVTLTGGGGGKGLRCKTASRRRTRSNDGGSATNGQLNIKGRIDPRQHNHTDLSFAGGGDGTGSEGTDFIFEIALGVGGGSFLSSDGALAQKNRQSTTGGTVETINGANGVNGTGGDGGYVGFQVATANGGNGGDGMVVIEEYA